MVEAGPSSWMLNPKSVFTLTISTEEKSVAEQFKTLLDNIWDSGPYKTERDLVPLLAQTNARVAEVDAYVTEFRPKYLAAIERFKRESSEWANSSEKDRQDLLATFRSKGIEQLNIRPDCDIETLFEREPQDATVDDALIAAYGFDNLQLYLRYADKLDKVHTIPADHASREAFEDLVKLGLAIRGQDIPVETLLSKLTLKEMADLAADLEHPSFTRKAKAIEFLSKLPNIRERLGKNTAFRELFQLKGLPEQFSHIPLAEVAGSWAHAAQVATLLTNTYWSGGWETLNNRRFEDEGYSWIKGWQIQDAEHCCPFCEVHAKKTSTKRSQIKIPLHIGCKCRLNSITD